MSDTTFTNGVTLTDSDWFNDVNRLHYTIFGDPANTVSAAAAIGLDFTNVRVGGTLSVSAQAAVINLQVAGVLSVSAGAVFNALATTDLSASAVAGLVVATQAQMEAGSATNKIVTPGRQQFHPGAAKAWGVFSGTATSVTAAAAYNVTSIARTGVGQYTVTFTVPFSGNSYAFSTGVNQDGAAGVYGAYYRSMSAASIAVLTEKPGISSNDATIISFVAYGDQ